MFEDIVISKNAALMRHVKRETKGIREGISEGIEGIGRRSQKREDEEHKRERGLRIITMHALIERERDINFDFKKKGKKHHESLG